MHMHNEPPVADKSNIPDRIFQMIESKLLPFSTCFVSSQPHELDSSHSLKVIQDKSLDKCQC